MVLGCRVGSSGWLVQVSSVLVALCLVAFTPQLVQTGGVDLENLPDVSDDQFWSTYKASIPYQDYVRLSQDAAVYVDRYGPRQLPGENDTLFRFRRFLRIQKELEKRLLLYYELNARQQEREREYEENRELEKLTHHQHHPELPPPPLPPSVLHQQQTKAQNRQHRFGQYQLPYPNQQMLDDVRPYPHEDVGLQGQQQAAGAAPPNDFSFEQDVMAMDGEDGEVVDEEGKQHRLHQQKHLRVNTNKESSDIDDVDEDGLLRWQAVGRVAGAPEASGIGELRTAESGAASGGRNEWVDKQGQEEEEEEFAYAPPDPRFYDTQEQKDNQLPQIDDSTIAHHPSPLPSPAHQPLPLLPLRRPDTFPKVPQRKPLDSVADPDQTSSSSGSESLLLVRKNDGTDDAMVDEATLTNQELVLQQRNNGNKDKGLGDGGGFRFNMLGKWPALGTGIGEKHLVIGNPADNIDESLQVQPVHQQHRFGAGDSAGVYIIAIVAGISAAATVGLIAFGIGWYNLQKHVKSTTDVEYPAYGVTGPNKELSPSGDRRLAQSAQMYHYQHQKQQIIAMESRAAAGERHGSISQADSDEENEEGDYTVYECPGLAPTGEMEVKNPMFIDEPTPAQTPQVKISDQPPN